MIEYKDIERVNLEAEKTDVKDKPYTQVNERIKAFRKLYPDGRIETELVSVDANSCIFRATVSTVEGYILGTGTAREEKASSYINKTSYIENCETSAVGRALGMAGLGIDTAIASADEVVNAKTIQEEIANTERELIDAIKVKALMERCNNDGVDIKSLCRLYKVETLEDLTNRKYANITENWDKIAVKSKGGRENVKSEVAHFEIH